MWGHFPLPRLYRTQILLVSNFMRIVKFQSEIKQSRGPRPYISCYGTFSHGQRWRGWPLVTRLLVTRQASGGPRNEARGMKQMSRTFESSRLILPAVPSSNTKAALLIGHQVTGSPAGQQTPWSSGWTSSPSAPPRWPHVWMDIFLSEMDVQDCVIIRIQISEEWMKFN